MSKKFYKQKNIENRQALTMTNKKASSGLWKNVILTQINNHHRWYHMLCEERHLVPRYEAPNW